MKATIWFLFITASLAVISCSDEIIPAEISAELSVVDTLYITAIDTIGVEFGQEASVFAFLVACGYTPDGNIAVLDARKVTFQIFDPAGEEIMLVGESGQGPGEYQMPLALAILEDGFVVSDLAGSKMIRFNSDGSLRDEINDFGMMPPSLITGTTGENYIALHVTVDFDGEDGPRAEMVFAAFGDSSEPEVVYESYPLDMHGGALVASAQHCAGGLDGEAILAEQSDSLFMLASFSATGEEVFRISEEWSRVPLTEEELAEDQLAFSIMIGEEGTTLDTSREPRTDEYRTIIEGVGVDAQGRIWVQMGDKFETYFRIYSAQGELRAVAFPDESIADRADYSISPYGFLAFDPDPDDWPKIYLIGVSE